jgi:hypothetical protein
MGCTKYMSFPCHLGDFAGTARDTKNKNKTKKKSKVLPESQQKDKDDRVKKGEVFNIRAGASHIRSW